MNYIELFNSLHPDFFLEEYIRTMPENHIFAELIMDLRVDTPKATSHRPDGITFGEYRGDVEALREAVRQVDEDWMQYFNEGDRFFCAFDGERIVAFCILSDMGTFQGLRIGGPGCVGTIPEYRKRGIGLEMVRLVTEVLKRDDFDLSWIHHTHLEHWYMKLGYRSVLRWNSSGILRDTESDNSSE